MFQCATCVHMCRPRVQNLPDPQNPSKPPLFVRGWIELFLLTNTKVQPTCQESFHAPPPLMPRIRQLMSMFFSPLTQNDLVNEVKLTMAFHTASNPNATPSQEPTLQSEFIGMVCKDNNVMKDPNLPQPFYCIVSNHANNASCLLGVGYDNNVGLIHAHMQVFHANNVQLTTLQFVLSPIIIANGLMRAKQHVVNV